MTKWFDTNYHYIVPEIALGQTFELDATKLLAELDEARELGIATRPAIVGPVTFLRLSKLAPGAPVHATTLNALDRLLPVYEELLAVLAARGVAWVQLDEPCLVLDLDRHTREAYRRSFQRLSFSSKRPKLLLATYFGALDENLDLALRSGFEALQVDLVRGARTAGGGPDRPSVDYAGSPLASSTAGTSGGPISTAPNSSSDVPSRRWAPSG